VSSQLHTPVLLSSGKEPPTPTGQEAGRVPQPVWTRWLREKLDFADIVQELVTLISEIFSCTAQGNRTPGIEFETSPLNED
jgi:hypothetical protein